MKLVLIGILVGELTVTSYRSVARQTDSTPNYTSTYQRVQPGGVAVSRDLLCGACRKLHRRCEHPEDRRKIHYGDWLYVEKYGFRFVNDCMGDYTRRRVDGRIVKVPIRNQIDLWVKTYSEERAVNVRRLQVYVIREKKRERSISETLAQMFGLQD